MKKNLKLLNIVVKKIFFIFLTFFIFHQNTYGYEKKFFCTELAREIKKNSDIRYINDQPIFGFGFTLKQKLYYSEKIDSWDWEFDFDNNGYATIDKVNSPKIIKITTKSGKEIEGETFRIGDKLVAENDIPVNKISEYVFEYFDKKNKIVKYTISRGKDNSKELLDFYIQKAYRYKLEVTPEFEINHVNYLDSKKGVFGLNFNYSYSWDEERLTKVAREIIRKQAVEEGFDNKRIDKLLDTAIVICRFTDEEFADLGLFDPKLEIINLVNTTEDNIKTKQIFASKSEYLVSYLSKSHFAKVDPYKYPKGTILIQKKILGSGTFSSKFKFRSFPFDSQNLNIDIGSKHYAYDSGRVEIIVDAYTPLMLQKFLKDNNFLEWKAIATQLSFFRYPIRGLGDSDAIRITIHIERNYEYYITKILLPIFLILIVSWSVFWITPREIESRLTVSIVCLLALIAYNFVVDDDLPKLAYLTVMDYIILVSYMFATIPTIITIASFIYYDKKNFKISALIDEKSKMYFPLAYILFILTITATIIQGNPYTVSFLGFLANYQ